RIDSVNYEILCGGKAQNRQELVDSTGLEQLMQADIIDSIKSDLENLSKSLPIPDEIRIIDTPR
ncbi:MAG: hypothetical protein PHN44_05450, partial [Candidatus Marinimicrobia bacterium]|nr:hypothetical protein [Candidatus Neomarinimicrobiota bacterium]